ncbi:cellulose binding domain-containing protein [Actinoallomurus spadix]|uniref:cellulose binding domain-containing protein n=1 Tax=Actinoallomurus spadix TaxID=79912 RepID=UPI0020927651|nr:cellulose binding domain-containing protein [Actinoallomurus spadix]MCO5991398.1 cellulose binding domain-containing protein [Actinoallomurus spadix]
MGERDGGEVLPHLRTTDEIPRPARPVPATDVQLRPVVPPPEPPPTPPATVQESVPVRHDVPVTVEAGLPVPPPDPYGAPATVEGPAPRAYGAPGERGVPFPPGAPRPPAKPRGTGGGVSRRLAIVAVAGAGVLLVAIGVLVAVLGSSSGGPAPSTAPAPCGHGPCAPSPTHSAPAPVAQVPYRTVERDAGYFEATATITNHESRPMRSWTLSFTYPGAEIRNTWDAVLQRRGTETILTGTATSPPIAPGASLQVRFGGSGAPSMPTGCRLNGAPCAFVAG